MIYVLKLEDNHFFLMRSSEKSDAHILFEAEILHEFPKIYLPELVYERHNEESPIDLDRYVKHYMIWFGIDNVRGGSYLKPILPDYQERALIDEMNTVTSDSDCIPEHLNKYVMEPYTKDELKKRLSELHKNYTKYSVDKNKEILIDIIHIRSELQWLKMECENQLTAFSENKTKTFLFRIEKVDTIVRYHKILQLLKSLRTIITDVLDISIKDPNIKFPEFVFDDFLYHHHRMNISSSIENLYTTINEYDHLLNIIENRKAERDFDIASWGQNAGKDMPREMYILQRICRTP
jgi:hypothetical protein